MGTPAKPVFTNIEIRKVLLHRYPFLLIDRVDSKESGPNPKSRVGNKAIVRKNVTANEPFFNGHFPENPVMPGVLQIEAMAQAGGMACYRDDKDACLELVIAGVNKCKFRAPVVPGDTLMIHAEVLKDRGSIIILHCKSYVDSKLVSEVELMCSILKKNSLGKGE
ncbi:MAG: 3-hydroxyacyl-ACP dehydratase FabZ [Bdellovibrionaceae bacterium]|jgi:3-hydroxyacyl-[acyl-carrier-protein] dehydratase|nr:3-hydroxyacyl-ACP dehydratase FabZ [Pseudobdellovibrionaceae bacterium]